MALEIRWTTPADAPAILALYKAASAAPGGLARRPDEVELAWVEGFIASALNAGVALCACRDGDIVGELHAPRMVPRQFRHVLSDLTIAVHPDGQAQGVGARLFEALFAEAAKLTPKVERIELMVRKGNSGALRLYQRLGFVIEGRFPGRVRLPDGTRDDDLALGRRL